MTTESVQHVKCPACGQSAADGGCERDCPRAAFAGAGSHALPPRPAGCNCHAWNMGHSPGCPAAPEVRGLESALGKLHHLVDHPALTVVEMEIHEAAALLAERRELLRLLRNGGTHLAECSTRDRWSPGADRGCHE